MPKRFDKKLAELREKVVAMGDLAQRMFRTALRALAERDEGLIASILEIEERVDRYQVEIDEAVVNLMAVFGPVALDLRFVLMTARINTELERIGDQSVNMSENVRLLLAEPELKKPADLGRMAEIAANMINESLEAFREGSTQRARKVIETDSQVDALHDQIFRELLTYMTRDAKNITRSVGLLLTARALERIADHATNIAEEVIYMVKGEDVRHAELQERR